MFQTINNDNFIPLAAYYYTNVQCLDEQEFFDDLKRFKYLKRLFNQYQREGNLRERHILNHIIALRNVFEPRQLVRMLFFRLNEYQSQLVPFLILLNILPEKISIQAGTILHTSDIKLDPVIVERLRKI